VLHIEFHKVDLKEKVEATVPLEFTGEAPAVTQKIGALLTMVDEIQVEALPMDLPEKITVDVSKLSNLNDELKISDLKVPAGVTVVTSPEQVIVRVTEMVSKQAEAEAAAEAAQSAAAKEAQAEAAPAAAPAAQAPATETKPESKGK
jgi:large subunit ribosomal protein L25